MPNALVPKGRLQVATPLSVALGIRNPTVAQTAVDERINAQVAPLVAQAIADDDTVVQAAADAAESAVAAAGQRTFFLIDGAASVLAHPDFDVAPSSSTSSVPGNWYSVDGSALVWDSVADGPGGSVAHVIRASVVNTWFRQRRDKWQTDQLAGKTVTVRIQARALPAAGQTTASARVLITRVATGVTLMDTRLPSIGAAWETRDLTLTIPGDIGNGFLQFSFAVHGSAPVGSSTLEFASVRIFVPSEDLTTQIEVGVSAAVTKGAGGVWAPGVSYPAGAVIVTPLGHRLRATAPVPAGTRFTDTLPLWKPVEAPPQEQILLGRSRLGHGQTIGVGDKLVIVLRFDDWQIAFGSLILPILTRLALPAGLASISDLTTQPWAAGITGADVRGWNRLGVEICSHGLDHKDPSPHDLMGAGGLYDQIVRSKAMIESWGVHCRGWMQPGATPLIPGVTPYGTTWTNWAALDGYANWLIRETYPVSMSDVWGAGSRPIPHQLMHGASHLTISDGLPYETTMTTLETALARGRSMSLMIHSGNVGSPGNITLEQLTQVFEWIAARRDEGTVEVLTPTGLFFADRSTHREDAIRNGGFEAGATGWSNVGGSRTIQTTGGHTGQNFARFTGSEAGLITQSILQLVSLGWAGHTFMFTGWARAMTGTTTSRVTLTAAGTDLALDLTREGIGTTWTPVRHAFSIPPDATSLVAGIGRAAGAGIEWDDISIQPI